MQGEEFRLYLDTLPNLVDSRMTVKCISWDPHRGQRPGTEDDWSARIPIMGIAALGGATNPLFRGFTVEAQDGASNETEGFDTERSGNWKPRFSTLSEYRNRLKIRRPRADLDALPILLGNLFEPDMADVPPEGGAALEQLLPRLRCSGGAQILVVVKDDGDELFMETLGLARGDALKEWLREHGVDPGSIDWTYRTGPQDDVQVKFGN